MTPRAISALFWPFEAGVLAESEVIDVGVGAVLDVVDAWCGIEDAEGMELLVVTGVVSVENVVGKVGLS